MFPHKEKSALVKKDMQILQDIAEQDTDVNVLLHLVLTIATNRVVVKRPSSADFLGEIKPQTSIKTKNTASISIEHLNHKQAKFPLLSHSQHTSSSIHLRPSLTPPPL